MKLDDNLKTQKSQQKKSKVGTSFNFQSKHLVGKLLIMSWITYGLLVVNFWVKKKSCRNILIWDLVLKISTRLVQW